MCACVRVCAFVSTRICIEWQWQLAICANQRKVGVCGAAGQQGELDFLHTAAKRTPTHTHTFAHDHAN